MSKGGKIALGIVVVLVILVIGIGTKIAGWYNGFVKLDEGVKQSWSQVQNVYQRRLDLIPNLVETVKGYAAHERGTLEAVIEARSKVGGVMQLNAKDLTPENMAKFQQAQAGLSGALQRLMVVVEQYPNLKADQQFLNLQEQLKDTENGITTERQRFTQMVQEYNQNIRRFPQAMIAGMFGFTPKAYFQADEDAQKAPKVQF
jgi:LemA protein